MRRMMFALAATALTLAATAPARAGAAAHALAVYKVDSVTAGVKGRKLTISATGAVNSGGWENPHLHALRQRHAETDTLVVEFLASPPPPNAAVIQALLPVSATITIGLPRYATTKVKVVAETNAMTADIQTKP